MLAEGGDPIKDGNAWVLFKANADGTRGDNLTTEYNEWKGNLEPGDYVIVAEDGEAKAEQLVKIEAGQVYKPVFVLNAGLLIIHPKPSEGADVADGAAVVIDYPGTAVPPRPTTATPKWCCRLATRRSRSTIGEGSVAETIPLAAGQTVEKDIVVGVGHVVANAFYVAGGDKVDAGGLTFHVVKAKKKIDGSREDVLTNYGAGAKFDLPPDDYVAITSLDQATVEEPFSIKAGEYKELNVSLNAGVLAISSPGASAIRILEQKKDIQGNRKELAVGYEQNFQTTMPAGDYAIVAERPDNGGAKEGTATVKAGERTEVTVQ